MLHALHGHAEKLCTRKGVVLQIRPCFLFVEEMFPDTVFHAQPTSRYVFGHVALLV